MKPVFLQKEKGIKEENVLNYCCWIFVSLSIIAAIILFMSGMDSKVDTIKLTCIIAAVVVAFSAFFINYILRLFISLSERQREIRHDIKILKDLNNTLLEEIKLLRKE